jgi:hypothetical protein
MRYAQSILFLVITGLLIVAFPAQGKDARKNAGNEAKVIFIVR